MISFSIPSKIVLNSNSMPSQWFVKSSRASKIREMAQELGVTYHSNPEKSKELLGYNNSKSELTSVKSRKHKAMKKAGYSKEEIEIKLAEIEDSFHIPKFPNEMEYMFEVFSINVKVFPPTRRRMDPPNLYPTIKPLIDGLTDCGWWEDDDYEHLKKLSFEYGGTSGEKGVFKILFEIVEEEEGGGN